MSGPTATLVCALSFEERCIGALADSIKSRNVKWAHFLDYSGYATPGQEAHNLRESNWATISRMALDHGICAERHHVNPYSLVALERLLHQLMEERKNADLFVDLTCLTKPHTVAAARTLATHEDMSWQVAYTMPMSYGNVGSQPASHGWKDTLLLPIGADPSLRNEGVALGVFIVGHEADRAAIAFNEMEPAAGVILLVRRSDRPDLHRLAESNNEELIRHLRKLRIPGPRATQLQVDFPWGVWQPVDVELSSIVHDFTPCITRLVGTAQRNNAPILVYPLGPKVAVFLTVLYLAKYYAQASWVIYPVARTHTLNYSDGILGTRWYSNNDISKQFSSERRTRPKHHAT